MSANRRSRLVLLRHETSRRASDVFAKSASVASVILERRRPCVDVNADADADADDGPSTSASACVSVHVHEETVVRES
ncbi:Hypothetical protein A7982_01217 [Minicystis rosea]|nr:Hypothetical protein A7982_01217 [Minicystis rosea]